MEKTNTGYIVTKDELGFTKGNRLTIAPHVKRIAKAMEKGETIPPIFVNSLTNHIVDGQNRYRAACLLWEKGIEYELHVWAAPIQNEDELAKILNANQRPWKAKDYVEYNLIHNIPGYKDFVEFLQEIVESNFYKSAYVMFGTSTEAVKESRPIYGTKEQAYEIYNLMKEVQIQTGIKETKRPESVIVLKEFLPLIIDNSKFAQACTSIEPITQYSSPKKWRAYYSEAFNKMRVAQIPE